MPTSPVKRIPQSRRVTSSYSAGLVAFHVLLVMVVQDFANMNCSLVQAILSGGELDFEREWNSLSISLRNIHTKNASTLSFEELYRNAYKLVLKKKGEPLYNKVKEFEQDWLAHEVRPQILEELPPSLLAAYNGAHLTVNEKRVAGERLLRSLKSAWEDHNLTMNMTTDVLMYMVRGISLDDIVVIPCVARHPI